MADRKEAAQYYMKKNKILELFDNITTALVYARPEDPKPFMIEHLKQLQSSKLAETGCPCIFDDSNVTSIFGILDPAGNGHITHSQYREAMKNFGVTEFNRNPPGSDADKITLDVFLEQMNEGLKKSSSTF